MKDIKGYEGLYKITKTGRVFGVKRGKYLKPRTDRDGYKRVGLSKDGTLKTHLVHRLVADAYIPVPVGCVEVCHKDNNPANNNVSNLYWGTHQENMKQMSDDGRWPYSDGSLPNINREYKVFKNGVYVDTYYNFKQLHDAIGVCNSTISCYISGKKRSPEGYEIEVIDLG